MTVTKRLTTQFFHVGRVAVNVHVCRSEIVPANHVKACLQLNRWINPCKINMPGIFLDDNLLGKFGGEPMHSLFVLVIPDFIEFTSPREVFSMNLSKSGYKGFI